MEEFGSLDHSELEIIQNAELENEIQNEEFRIKNCSYLAMNAHSCFRFDPDGK